MAFGSEVRGVLGIDTSKIPADLGKALQAFKGFARQTEAQSGKTGDQAGKNLIGGIEHHIFGARQLSGALATALGLNIGKIGDSIAAAITGGTAEGWKEAGEITDRNAQLIEESIESHLTRAQLGAKLKRDLERAEQGEADANKGQLSKAEFLGMELGVGGLAHAAFGESDADKLKRQQTATNVRLTAQARLDEFQKSERDTVKQIADSEKDRIESQLTKKQQVKALDQDILNIGKDLINNQYSASEIAKKQAEQAVKQAQIDKLRLDIAKDALDVQKNSDAEDQKKLDLSAKLLHRGEDEAKLTDRSKLSLGATVVGPVESSSGSAIADQFAATQADFAAANAFGVSDNLTDAQRAARDSARKIQDIEQRAEKARISGDQAGAQTLLDQAGGMREELVKAGFTKSTEGDPMKALREQIAKDNLEIKGVLTEIKQIEAGRYVNTA